MPETLRGFQVPEPEPEEVPGVANRALASGRCSVLQARAGQIKNKKHRSLPERYAITPQSDTSEVPARPTAVVDITPRGRSRQLDTTIGGRSWQLGLPAVAAIS